MSKFQGIIVPMVTPFNRYNYRIGKRAILAAEEVAKFMADF